MHYTLEIYVVILEKEKSKEMFKCIYIILKWLIMV